jgi:glutathione S-transferase
MSDAAFKATAYIKDGCPFSFKFLVFMAEGRLLDRIEIVRMREGDPTFAAKKQHLSEQLGKPATFPTVEVEPHRYLTDSDLLIEHFARRHGLRPDDMPVLSFYKATIFPQLIELYKIKAGKS